MESKIPEVCEIFEEPEDYKESHLPLDGQSVVNEAPVTKEERATAIKSLTFETSGDFMTLEQEISERKAQGWVPKVDDAQESMIWERIRQIRAAEKQRVSAQSSTTASRPFTSVQSGRVEKSSTSQLSAGQSHTPSKDDANRLYTEVYLMVSANTRYENERTAGWIVAVVVHHMLSPPPHSYSNMFIFRPCGSNYPAYSLPSLPS